VDAFIELFHSMGSLDEIIADPVNAKLPTEPSTRYAVCTALGRLATKKNFAPIVTYAERLPREAQILVVHDATTRDEALKNTATYGKWAVANQDVLMQ
jgi:Ni,Fe-hydrogenase III small subunit